MQLGQAIAQIRKERGLTQEAFAKMYNVTRQTVSNWENEKQRKMVIRTIKAHLITENCYIITRID